MSDLSLVAVGVAELLLLGSQTTKRLYDFYKPYQNKHKDLIRIVYQLYDLLHPLETIIEAARTRVWHPNAQETRRSIESFVEDSKDIVLELQNQAEKIEKACPIHVDRDLVIGRKAPHPFKRSTLLKLGEEIDNLRENLSIAFQALQLGQIRSSYNQLDDVSSSVGLKEESESERSQRYGNINIDGYAQVHVGDTFIQNDTSKLADLMGKLVTQNFSSELRQWLGAPDAMTDLHIASAKRCPGTGQWLLRDPTFIDWSQQANSYLWLYGFAGCGKSVLCSTAIRHVLEFQRTGNTDSVVGFFFFTFNDESKRNASAAVRALLLQLSGYLPGLTDDLNRVKESCNHGDPPLSTLLECLRNIVTRHRHVYILLDALDESPAGSPRDEVLLVIKTIRQWQLPSLHLLITSRDLPSVRDNVLSQGAECITLKNDGVHQDIAQYISFQVDQDRQLQDWGDSREKIKIYLTHHAGGVFRWVECQLRPLRRCPRSEKHLEKCLCALPQNLDLTYERILCEIESQEEARRILSLLCFASRPLSVDEVIEAIAVDVDDLECYDPRSRLACGADDLLRICPELIEIGSMHRLYDEDGSDSGTHKRANEEMWKSNIVHTQTVRIAHFSVQEYLLSDRIKSSPAHEFALSKSAEHGLASKVCLLYLDYPEFLGQPLSVQLLNRYAFAKYAAQHWHIHYHQAEDHFPEQVLDVIMALLTTPTKLERWLRLHNPERPWHQAINYLAIFRKPPSPTYFASLLGLSKVLSHLVSLYPKDVSIIGGRYGSALQAASFNGHVVAAQTLLHEGAEVNAQGGVHCSALQAASFNGHDTLVKLLLDEGADVNLSEGYHGSALQAASYNGHFDTVQILLGHEAGPNVLGGYHGSALQAASSKGYGKIAKLLLDEKAEVNVRGGHYGTALHAASSNGHDAIVQLLLDENADVNIQETYYGSAVQTASYNGHESIVQILIHHGADVNAQGGYYGNPLQAATYSGHEKIVQILLAKGADVNAHGGHYNTALQAALQYGQKRIAQVLIDAGADVNSRG